MGKRLRELRKSRKLTQAQLAEAVGISAKTISDYENDKVMPSLYILEAIAEYLNVSIDYLLKGETKNNDAK